MKTNEQHMNGSAIATGLAKAKAAWQAPTVEAILIYDQTNFGPGNTLPRDNGAPGSRSFTPPLS